MDSKSIIRHLRADGWFLVRTKGSHQHFKHPVRAGLVTVPYPAKDVPAGTVKSIERQSGTRLRLGST